MKNSQRENVVQEGAKGSSIWLVYLLIGVFIAAYVYENREALFSSKRSGQDGVVEGQTQQPPSAPRQTPAQLFYQATAAGDLVAMQALYSQLGPDEINAVTNGMTPIMIAASTGNVPVLEFLLAHNADPNKRGAMERTALQYAAERNRLDAAKLLLAHGADINGVDNTKLSPLVMAADRRYQALALYLIDKGADVNLQHVQGWTALIDASRNGDLVVVKRLLEAGANPQATTGNGWTALDYARHNRHTEIAQVLMAKLPASQ